MNNVLRVGIACELERVAFVIEHRMIAKHMLSEQPQLMLETVEERARHELGMLKEGETLYQLNE